MLATAFDLIPVRRYAKVFSPLAMILIVASLAHADHNLFVSAQAEAGGEGTREKPLGSLSQARDHIRALRKAGTLTAGEAVTVHVASGIYPTSSSFELTAADSGTVEGPVVYRAESPHQARIQGGMTLAAAWFQPVTELEVLARLDAPVREHVRVCDLADRAPGDFADLKPSFRGAPAAPWLYVNQQPMTLARWPNVTSGDAGWATFTQSVDTGLPQPQAADPSSHKLHPGAFRFDDPRPERWHLEQGVWLFGYWTHDWSDEVIRIASYDKVTRVIGLAAPHSYGINAGTWGAKGRRFFAMNVLEELDSPGEWYLDRRRKRLYFYPPLDLNDAEIVLATSTQPLVKLDGARHVKLIGLRFEYAHADGILARNVEHVEIAGCTIANLAGSGVSLSGTESTIRSCDLWNLGRSGIGLAGGDRQTLALAGNVAENNHIHHYGQFQRTYAAGIHAHGCGQVASRNRIHDAPHNAVQYGGNEHRFERNDVYRVVLETGDAGAFYTGRDWTSRGNVLSQNFIHDLGSGNAEHVNTMGIYLDDCDCGDRLEGNLFCRAGRAIMIGGGRDNPVLGNLIVECPIGLHIDSRGMTWKQWNNPADKSWCLEEKAQRLNYQQPPWSTRYPRLAAIMNESPREPLGNSIHDNVFVDCSRQICNFDGNVTKLLDKFDMAENLVIESSNKPAKKPDWSGFRDLAIDSEEAQPPRGGDVPSYELIAQWQAWLRNRTQAWESIPVQQIGIYQDEFRVTLPPR
ncbi:MAG: right-handed parallel beta-helix repeat-containing protein [Planctomycetales bacterium]|nr:right-handed parallel beta-helix repeat-containing protein [Planctomycetales bacterium]